jgi:zinc transporter ZupT
MMGAVVILMSAFAGLVVAVLGYALFGLGLALTLAVAFGAGPAAAALLLLATTINQSRAVKTDGSATQPS